MFLGLLKQLIVAKPDAPLDYLIEKLQNATTTRRIILLGPPGTHKKSHGNVISALLNNFAAIDSGSLIKKEINRKTPLGMKVKESYTNLQYCEDDVIIELVRKAVADCEKDNKSYIITGFPRTQKQALALQSMGVVPDKIIVMRNAKKALLYQSKKNLQEVGDSKLSGAALDKKVEDMQEEYEFQLKGVREVFGKFLTDLNID